MAEEREQQVADVVPGVPGNMTDLPSEPDPPRENMIATAVRFLQNPKVRNSPFAQRRTFLTKKGLTMQEIDIAVARSGTAGDEKLQVAAPSGGSTASGPLVPVSQAPPPVPMLSRWRDYTATAIVVGGLSYGLYTLIQNYIKPIWFGPSEEQRRTEALMKSTAELQTSIGAVVTNLQEMQASLTKQQENINQVILNTNAQRGPVEMDRMQQQQYVSEIKGEIKSLKGLLLSRNQFPAAPKVTPVVPAWQLASSETMATPQQDTSSRAVPGETLTSSLEGGGINPVLNGNQATTSEDEDSPTSDVSTSLKVAPLSEDHIENEHEQRSEFMSEVTSRVSQEPEVDVAQAELGQDDGVN